MRIVRKTVIWALDEYKETGDTDNGWAKIAVVARQINMRIVRKTVIWALDEYLE